jgi:hypothetical protein
MKPTLAVERSPENGGPVRYSDREQLEADFAAGVLHPGDLKASVSGIMVQILSDVASALKSDGPAAKAAKELKAFDKKIQKKK